MNEAITGYKNSTLAQTLDNTHPASRHVESRACSVNWCQYHQKASEAGVPARWTLARELGLSRYSIFVPIWVTLATDVRQ